MDFTADQLPDTLTVEHNGTVSLLRDAPFVKEAPDLPTLIKQGYDAHREVGARVRLPGKDAKPEDVAAFKTKLVESGLLAAPPASPADYKIAKPADFPATGHWSDDLATKLAGTLHKHGVPVAAAADLLALHQEALGGAQALFATDVDTGMAALRAEFREDFDAKQALAGRLASAIFKTPEELAAWNASGLGNHPAFLGVLMRLAPLAEQDSSFMAEVHRPGGEIGVEELKTEITKIYTDPSDPRYEKFRRGDRETRAAVDELYRRAYGTAPESP